MEGHQLYSLGGPLKYSMKGHQLYSLGGPLKYSMEGHQFAIFAMKLTSDNRYIVSVSNKEIYKKEIIIVICAVFTKVFFDSIELVKYVGWKLL